MNPNFNACDDRRTMAAVRSSPRLRALLYSNPSGKSAVYAPRLNRVNTSDRILRSKNTKKKPLKDSETSSPSKLSYERKSSETRLGGGKIHPGGIKNRGRVSENSLEEKRCPLNSPKKRQQSLTSGTKTQMASKRSNRGRTLGHDNRKSVEVPTRCKQRKSVASSANNPMSSEHSRTSITGSTDTSTGMGIKRKRGRPPKNTESCKRMKMATATTTPSQSGFKTDKPKVVIDLTCEDETIGDEDTDTVISTPPLATNPDLTQAASANSRALMYSSEASKDELDGEGVDGDCSVSISSIDAGSDYLRTSLDPDETLAQLFDLGMKEDYTNVNGNLETVTIPSLKRSKNINLSIDVSSSEQSLETKNSNGDTLDTLSSPTEEEYPQPSTPQQKLIRRLARQKQLEEMRAREAAQSREERLLRRKGVLPDIKAVQSSAKRISWRDETDLVEMFIYSPVRDDDDDTVSIHSDDALNMELTLSTT